MSYKKRKVLYCLNDLANGGIESFCLNVNKNIDKNKYDIDYFLTVGNSEYYKTEFKSLGRYIFNIKNYKSPNYMPDFLKLFYAVNYVIRKNNYEVLHIHQCKGTISILLAAKINKVEVVCIHSHSAFIPKSKNVIINLKVKIYSLIRNSIGHVMNIYRLGCSKDACKYMFGKECFKNKKTRIIFNGLDFQRFNKLALDKDIIVKRYNIDKESINFINIGRFEEVKNQLFLIKIFSELVRIRKNIKLTIVGYGSLEQEIRDEIKKLNVDKYVNILPQDTNIPEILSCMDYFLFPSLYEGLGIVLIEAQAMGVQCFTSNYVPEEADVGLCEFIPLEIGAKRWAEYIDKYIQQNKYGEIDKQRLNKYDIKNVVLELENIYSSKS